MFMILIWFGACLPAATVHASADRPAFQHGEGPASVSVKLPGRVDMRFVRIPVGVFLMGSPEGEPHRHNDEGPVRLIQIPRPFYLGIYEVTQRQWEAVTGENPSYLANNPDHPVEQVSWDDCQAFIRKLNGLGLGLFRLPTEAEWEFACRAGTTTPFYWGEGDREKIDDHAWYWQNSSGRSQRVGRKQSNRWGLYDMSGNVMEWCQDHFGRYECGDPIDPQGPAEGQLRVFRGGCWRHGSQCCRSAFRNRSHPDLRVNYLGLRLVMERP